MYRHTETNIHFSWGKYLEVRWLVSVLSISLTLFLNKKHLPHCFATWLYYFAFPPAKYESSVGCDLTLQVECPGRETSGHVSSFSSPQFCVPIPST